MKRLVFFALLGFVFTEVCSQTDMRRVNNGVEDAVARAIAKDRAEKEAKAAKEASDRTRHQQLRTQQMTKFNNSMNNLNQVIAENFINNPHGLNINTNNNKNAEVQQTPTIVATPKTTKRNRSQSPFANSGKIGTPSFSGDNYTGDRYNLKPAGFDNTHQAQHQPQLHKPRMSAKEMRNKYQKQGQTTYQGVTSIQRANTPPKTTLQQIKQQNNSQNEKEQGSRSQKRRELVREEIATNRYININSSQGLYPNTGQDNSSPDLAVPDIAKHKDATKAYKMQPSSHSQAHYLSDGDNKRPSGVVKLANGYRTLDEEARMARKDAANGFSSFDNPREWDYIYNVEHIGNVKTSSRSVTSKR